MSDQEKVYYGTIVVKLVLFGPDQVSKDQIDYLETNLESQMKAVINYAKKSVSLGPNDDAAIESASWEWQ